eukprot:TRINITY_DN103242_c0_g1_i1.p1 TRINITY_DN103242_c0_g1~~TRINITY_DN103242_c0_g1_i1.p1  ORF type:complete len:975 (-),score=139.94 TRINITY_DN103242_c0_g1_i1:85-3009(-)
MMVATHQKGRHRQGLLQMLAAAQQQRRRHIRGKTILKAALLLLPLANYISTSRGVPDPALVASSSPAGSDETAADAAGLQWGRPERHLLPGEVKPLRYDIQVELNPERSEVFRGQLNISVDVLQETSSITMNARNLSIAIESVVFQTRDSNIHLDFLTDDGDDERIILQFDRILPKGPATLSLQYEGMMGNDMAGLYRSKYRDLHGNVRYLALTQFEAVDARRMLPCWDEPSKKAVFALSLVLPSDLMAVSNMPAASDITIGKYTRRVTFLDTPKMSTYLLALAVGRFDSIQKQSSTGTLVRVLTVPGQAWQGEFALDVAVRALEFYEDFFQVPYPLPKLDMLAAPDFAAGAMENWGLVIYREVDLLCNKSSVGVARKMRIATVVTHELAHMWFGNLVTMEWWEQLWLNEGFANWMQTHAADILFPEWKIWEQYVVQEQSRALGLDGLRSSHPIEVPIRQAKEVDEVFDAISYSKGGSVVRMVCGLLGQKQFQAGLVLYMQRFAYSNTDSSDLWACWEEVSGLKISDMMRSWTRQQGFPVLVVDSSGDSVRGSTNSRLSLSQHWFLADGSELPGDKDKVWHVPLQPGPLKRGQLNAPEILDKPETIWRIPEGSGGWLKFNFGQMAPYRVLYSSPSMRTALVEAVRSGEVDAVDRVGLLFDSLAFARQGSMPFADLLRLVGAFRTERNAHVWEALSMVLSTVHRTIAGLRSDSSAANQLKNAIADNLIRPALTEIGWTARSNETDLERQKRALIVGLAARYLRSDIDVAHKALNKFNSWVDAPSLTDALPDDLKTSVFCIVLSNSQGEAPYRKLRQLASRAETPQAVRLSIYTALGAAPRTDLRKKTLDMALGGRDSVRLQDVMYPVSGVALADRDGARLAWQWFVDHRIRLCKRLRTANVRLLGAVIESAARAVPDAAHADAVEALFEDHPVPGLERSIAQIVEGIRTEARFVQRLASEIGSPEMKDAVSSFTA